MNLNEKIEKSINQQLQVHRTVNLYFENLDEHNFFLPETRALILSHKIDFLRMESENQSDNWIDTLTARAFKVFCNTNQYLDLRKKDQQQLRAVYLILWQELISGLENGAVDFTAIQKSHLRRLSDWIGQSNPFTKKINKPDMPEVTEVVCAQYSAKLQIELLGIDLANLIEPVLDIGCGEDATLVVHLRNMGIEAYGIDRIVQPSVEYLRSSNWMEYEFKPHSWGAIISNHSFALHFNHHHERQDGDYLSYARKYMEILRSLKVLGKFYYAPDLPFIEAYLPPEKYDLINRKVDGNPFNTSILAKLV